MTPIVAPSAVEPMPTASEMRAPWMMRLQTSRPKESVPSQCARSGDASAMRGIDVSGIVARDQIGGQIAVSTNSDHDDQADGAEQIALRQERRARRQPSVACAPARLSSLS